MNRITQTVCVWAVSLAVAAGLAGQSQAQVDAVNALNAPAPVLIDDAPSVQDMFARTTTFREQGRYPDAAALYQRIITDHANRLTPIGNDVYMDGRVRAMNELLADDRSLAAYRLLHDAVARRDYLAALQPVPDVAKLQRVTWLYGLTRAGLDASLALAAVMIERGEFRDALEALHGMTDHPDFATVANQWHFLQAVAGVYTGDGDLVARHIATLRSLNDGRAVATIRSLADSSTPLPPVTDVAPLNQVTSGAVPERLISPLWTVRLSISDPIGDSARPTVRMTGGVNGVQSLASLANDHIYFNTGSDISAVERYSGDKVWTFSESDIANRRAGDNMRRRTTRSPDLRGVAIHSDVAVTVLGGALRRNMMIGIAQAETSLVSLDVNTGLPLWTVATRDIDSAIEDAEFHGTPIISDGRVYAMLCRTQAAGFQDAYVAAFDLATGAVLWHRYLSSTAVTNWNAVRLLSQFSVVDGSLYVVDGLGVCARLDSRTGGVQWLSKMPDLPTLMEMRQSSTRLMQPWAMSTPVVTEAGLVVPAIGEARGAVVFNIGDGTVVKKLDSELWRTALYFTAIEDDLLVIGSTMARVAGDTLENEWTTHLGESSLNAPAGRAAMTRTLMLVPTPESVAVVNLSTGKVEAKSNIRTAGNLLALDDQLVLVDEESLQTYMNWDRAYARLSDMVLNATADPKPGLWLAHLALNARQRDAAVEGIDAALTALTALGTFHADEPDFEARYDDAFNRLLDLAQEPDRVDAAMKNRLFEQLAVSAITPRQQVDQRFAEATFLAGSGSPEKAVDLYQGVLFDQVMSQELYASASGARSARDEAREQIARLIEQHGRPIYQSYEDAAARALADLRRTDASAEAFIDLARRFPVAGSAPVAMIAGAERMHRDGNLREAIRVLHLAYADVSQQPALLQDVVGRLVTYNLDASQPRQALRWLRQAAREHPNLHPLRAGQPIALTEWMALIEPDSGTGRSLPTLTLPLGKVATVEGRLLLPSAQRAETLPQSTIITLLGNQLIAWDTATYKRRWAVDLPSAQVDLVHLSAGNVVLLTDYESTDATLQVLDTMSGKRIGNAIALGEAVSQIAPDVPQALQQIELRSRIHPMRNHARNVVMLNGRFVHGREAEVILAQDRRHYLAAANDTVIVVADRVGRTIAIDNLSGDVLWRMRCAFDRVEFLELTEEALVFGGALGQNQTIPDGSLWVLDPVTATPRMILQEMGAVPSWIRVSDDGILTYLVSGELVARYVGGGPQLWIKDNIPVASPVAVRAMAGDRLVYQIRPGYLRILDIATGNEVGDIQLADADSNIRLQHADQTLYLQSGEEVLAIDREGQVIWRDAIERSGKRLQMQLLGDKYLAAVALRSGPAINPGAVGEAPRMQMFPQQVIEPVGGPVRNQIVIERALERVDARIRLIEAENEVKLEVHRARVEAALPAGQNGRGARVVEPGREQVGQRVAEAVVVQRGLAIARAEPPREPVRAALAQAADRAPDDALPTTYQYVLYVMQRDGGLMVVETALPSLPTPIDPDTAAMVDGSILLTTSRQTIVIPGSAPAEQR